MSLDEELTASAGRWARRALDEYLANGAVDVVVHDLAVAVEHVSKAYLAAQHPVLIYEERPNFEDVLALVRGDVSLQTVHSVGGYEAVKRVRRLLRDRVPTGDREFKNAVGSPSLELLRDM